VPIPQEILGNIVINDSKIEQKNRNIFDAQNAEFVANE
jgi:hypothetical protein